MTGARSTIVTPQTGPEKRSLLGVVSTPSWWTIGTVAAIVIPALMILDLGPWYLVGLLGIYAALDVAQRVDMRRGARNRMTILAAAGQEAPSVTFIGSARHCRQAAWLARKLGWYVCPIAREQMFRHSIRFRNTSGAAPLHMLLEALDGKRLATRIRLRNTAPSFGKCLSEHGLWETSAIPASAGEGGKVARHVATDGRELDRVVRDAILSNRLLFGWNDSDAGAEAVTAREDQSRGLAV